ncbi:MAG: glutathione S-transferase family protein [Pseudoalteromonas prydzensis]|uniref:glutathione S-transferase family protein n=1 Tax=Pseudoalteromonas prydzensis TaxID=182141 RepID=UPI003F965CC3
MKVYGRTTSFNVQKVLWFIDELGLSYQHIEVGGRFGGLDSDDFLALNPLQKVPVLVDGDNVIWESHSILRYLAASYGTTDWYYASPYQRSLYERWMDWSQVIFQPAFMATFWGYYRKAQNNRCMERITRDLQACEQCLQIIEQQLSHAPYLAGGKITLADICVGAILYRLTSQGLAITLPERATQWFALLKTRAGYQKWIMSDFTELKGREDF